MNYPKVSRFPGILVTQGIVCLIAIGGLAQVGRAQGRMEFPLVAKVPATSTISSLAFSPDGRTLAEGGLGQLILASAKGEILQTVNVDDRMFSGETADKEPESVLNAGQTGTSALTRLAWSPDGKRLALVAEDLGVAILATDNWKPVTSWGQQQGGTYAVAWSPDGARVACGGAKGKVDVHSVADGSIVHSMAIEGYPVRHLSYSKDGSVLVGVGIRKGDGPNTEILRWDGKSGELLGQLGAPESSGVASSLSGNGRLFADTDGKSARLRLIDTYTGETAISSASNLGFKIRLCFSPSGTAVAGYWLADYLDENVHDLGTIWRVADRQELGFLNWKTRPAGYYERDALGPISMSVDGTIAIASPKDIRIWGVPS